LRRAALLPPPLEYALQDRRVHVARLPGVHGRFPLRAGVPEFLLRGVPFPLLAGEPLLQLHGEPRLQREGRLPLQRDGAPVPLRRVALPPRRDGAPLLRLVSEQLLLRDGGQQLRRAFQLRSVRADDLPLPLCGALSLPPLSVFLLRCGDVQPLQLYAVLRARLCCAHPRVPAPVRSLLRSCGISSRRGGAARLPARGHARVAPNTHALPRRGVLPAALQLRAK